MKYQITIEGYIGSWTKRMVRDVLRDNEGKPVNVSIGSLGGEVSAALAIYQMFKEHGDVTADFQAGFSASAATLCAMGAKTVRMTRYSLLLIHKCSVEQFLWDDLNEEQLGTLIQELQKQQLNQQKIDNIIANIYCERTGKKHEDVIRLMSEAAWLSPDECVSHRLVDATVDGTPIAVTEKVTNFIKYNNLPSLPEVVDTWGEGRKPGLLGRLLGSMTQPKNIKDMIKKWTHINNVLQVEGIEANEGDNTCAVSQEQMQQVEDTLAANSKKMAEDAEALRKVTQERDAFKDEADSLRQEKADLEERVKCLENEPGGETHKQVDAAPAQGYFSEEVLNTLNLYV